MCGFEENVQVESRFIAFELLKTTCHDGPRKAGLIPGENISFSGYRTGARTFWRGIAADTLFAAADHDHVRRDGNAHGGSEAVDAISIHREPAPGIEQVASVIAHVSKFETLHRTIISRIEDAFVFEGQRG